MMSKQQIFDFKSYPVRMILINCLENFFNKRHSANISDEQFIQQKNLTTQKKENPALNAGFSF